MVREKASFGVLMQAPYLFDHSRCTTIGLPSPPGMVASLTSGAEELLTSWATLAAQMSPFSLCELALSTSCGSHQAGPQTKFPAPTSGSVTASITSCETEPVMLLKVS